MSAIHRAFLQSELALRRFIGRYLTRSQDVDDVVQETFLQAFTAEAERPIEEPKAYLFRTARNLALNNLARKSNSNTDSIEDFSESDVLEANGQIAVDVQASDQQRLAITCEVILSLPPHCRRAFVLRKIHGLSYREIAEHLHISESTVEKHVAAGLQRCVETLRQRGHDPADFGAADWMNKHDDETRPAGRARPLKRGVDK